MIVFRTKLSGVPNLQKKAWLGDLAHQENKLSVTVAPSPGGMTFCNHVQLCVCLIVHLKTIHLIGGGGGGSNLPLVLHNCGFLIWIKREIQGILGRFFDTKLFFT